MYSCPVGPVGVPVGDLNEAKDGGILCQKHTLMYDLKTCHSFQIDFIFERIYILHNATISTLKLLHCAFSSIHFYSPFFPQTHT
jgi:hypothetical protein